MSDEPREPKIQAAEATRLDEEESPKLREVPEEEFRAILEAHEKWLASGGNEGEWADLHGTKLPAIKIVGVNLQGANLDGADLQGIVLREAKLQDDFGDHPKIIATSLKGANLRGAVLTESDLRGAILEDADLSETKLEGTDLRGANFYNANLRGADLRGAKLQETELAKANLREADLQDTDLTESKSFTTNQIAGTNVTGAKLPDDIAKFEGLDHVAEISKNARKIFLSMLLGCAYSWLTIATTTDARLLNSSASSPLPIIGTEIPIFWFYWAAPLILGAFYIYLHLYLQRLWESLAGLPARFQDGKRLDERAYPWLLNGLVRRHFKLLKEERPPITRLEEWVTIFLAWWAVPGTLLGFWLRYLPRHDWVGTSLHLGLAVATILVATIFYSAAARTLRGDQRQPFQWRKCWRDRRSYQNAGIIFAGIFFSVLSYGAIGAVRTPHPDFTDVRSWVPWTFEWFGYRTYAELRGKDVSVKPPYYWRLDVGDRYKSVKGAKLAGSDLRHADAVGAFLVKADLRKAKLQKANLIGAKLQKANLQFAKLQGANLQFANLQGADLRGVYLKGTPLWGAKIQGADFSLAKGLTEKQLDRACGDEKTKLPEYLKDYKFKPCPEEPK